MTSFFYAFSDMRTPLIAGISALIFNFILSVILMKSMGNRGLALAISISGATNFFILFIKLNSIISFSFKELAFSACRAVFVSGIMYFTIKILILYINNVFSIKISIFIIVAISVVIGILVYFGIHILIKSPEVKMIKNEILKSSKS